MIMINHNDFIDYRRMGRLVQASQDFLNESPVAFVTYGGISTGPKAIPNVRIFYHQIIVHFQQ